MGSRLVSLICCSLLLSMFVATAFAAPLLLTEQRGFLHISSGVVQEYDRSSPGFWSAMDAANYGSFGWRYVNNTGTTQTNLRFLGFLDADIDRDQNTFVNEYGTFVSLDLPPGAPAAALGASGWEIDEPGYVFGNIIQNLSNGTLDNSNAVPNGAPDDVSLALSFAISSLQPGGVLSATFRISDANIDGLNHADPQSGLQFFFNGYVQVTGPDGQPGEIPEPSTMAMMTIALGVLWRLRVSR